MGKNSIAHAPIACDSLGVRKLPVYTNSSITTFRRCPREYYFSYVLLRAPHRTSFALTFGRVFHRGLNAWWSTNGEVERLGAAIDAMRKDSDELDPFDLVKAECLMVGYTARWASESLATIAVENRFSVGVGGDSPSTRLLEGMLEGSIDAIASDERGRVYNIESKTTSQDISVASDYWRRVVAIDPQVTNYALASEARGYGIWSTIYDVTRKPDVQPLKATPEELKKYTKPTKAEPRPRLYANQRETDESVEEYRDRLTEEIASRPDWYFARRPVVRLDQEHDEHAADLVATVLLIQSVEARGYWPRSPNACERFHRLCDFFEVCTGETVIEDGTRFRDKAAQHEELSHD